MLSQLASYCGLDGQSDRMSVYHFHDGRFFLVARRAKNPTLAARGRPNYPIGQGAIGLAWEADEGQALVVMPAGKERWRRAAIKQGFAEAVADSMTMKSLCLAAHRLEVDGRSVGVLVVESKNPGRVQAAHLDKIAGSHIVSAIAELAAAFALMTPAGESFTAANTSKPTRKWQSVSPRAQDIPVST
jgi:hypothetical protein